MTDLTATQSTVLSNAVQHPERLVLPLPAGLKGGAANIVLNSLAAKGLIEEVEALKDEPVWRTDDDGTVLTLRATDAALQMMGVEPAARPDEAPAVEAAEVGVEQLAEADEAEAGTVSPTGAEEPAGEDRPPTAAEANDATPVAPTAAEETAPPARPGKRTVPACLTAPDLRTPAIEAFRDALITQGVEDAQALDAASWLEQVIERNTTAPAPRQTAREPKAPRTGTKQQVVIDLLRQPQGATIATIMAAVGWAGHSVRGYLASLKKKQGLAIISEKREDARYYRISDGQ